jgi:hypothetical protein
MISDIRFKRSQQGLTLVELLISTGLLFMIMLMGTTIFSNIQSHLKLAEKEAAMQQYARNSITRISRELRQARVVAGNRVCNPSPCLVPEYTDIYAVVPDVDGAGATSGTYSLVRYWFQEDHQKPGTNIMSLYRASKTNGTSNQFPGGVTPAPFTDNRSRLLREAAALNPGDESYFKIKGNLIEIVLIVAIYHMHPQSSIQYQIERKFRVDTQVQIRG